MLASLLRILGLFAVFFLILTATGLLLAQHQTATTAGEQEARGGYLDTVLPGVRQGLDHYHATWQQARTANRTAAAELLERLAQHEKKYAARLQVTQPPAEFAHAHRGLLGLYSDLVDAARAASACLLHPRPSCPDPMELEARLRAQAELVQQDFEQAAKEVASLA